MVGVALDKIFRLLIFHILYFHILFLLELYIPYMHITNDAIMPNPGFHLSIKVISFFFSLSMFSILFQPPNGLLFYAVHKVV